MKCAVNNEWMFIFQHKKEGHNVKPEAASMHMYAVGCIWQPCLHRGVSIMFPAKCGHQTRRKILLNTSYVHEVKQKQGEPNVIAESTHSTCKLIVSGHLL